MVKDTKVQELVINELTKERYEQLKDSGLISNDELYMITDEEYISSEDLQSALEEKQDVLTAGEGIDITNNVISATLNSAEWGNITGTLSDQSDLQNALNNKVNTSSLANVATSGDYNDLTNTPTIPAAQVQSDWNATTGMGVILNKPTIPTTVAELSDSSNYINIQDTTSVYLANVATSGDYNDLTNTPTIDQTYNASSTNAQSGIAVASAISNAISSAYKPAGSSTFDSLPTPSSNNLGNVYNMTDSFTTDSRFVEGSGKTYPAGSNVVVVNTSGSTYKFDVLGGFIDLSGYATINSLANVATSGDYNDLTNTPTIDQTYNASSTNAQSGIAVANAISNKSKVSMVDWENSTTTDLDTLIINKLTKQQYDALQEKFDDELYMITSSEDDRIIVDDELDDTSENPVQNKVIVGALDDKQDTLTAGTGIDITNNVISANLNITWGDISGNIVDQEDLDAVLNGKQDTLTAGSGISISNNTISTNGNVIKIVDNEPLIYEDGVVYFIKEN